tara:strand:- start:5837 stop:6037 length:201 start_codon:yes stop_codon:yes gene_type:complete
MDNNEEFDINISIEKERNILDDLNNILNIIGEFTDTNIGKPTIQLSEDYISKPIIKVTDDIKNIIL